MKTGVLAVPTPCDYGAAEATEPRYGSEGGPGEARGWLDTSVTHMGLPKPGAPGGQPAAHTCDTGETGTRGTGPHSLHLDLHFKGLFKSRVELATKSCQPCTLNRFG